MPGLANLSQHSNRERWAVLESWEIFPFLNNFTHREHWLTAPQTHPSKGHPRPRGCVLPVNYCMQDYLRTQVSTNIRQPDLVFFKNVLIHSFSFSFWMPWRMKFSLGSCCSYTSPCLLSPPFSMQAPPWAAMVAICRRREQWMDSGGGNKCPRFVSSGSTLNCAKPTQQHKQTQAGCWDPKVWGF